MPANLDHEASCMIFQSNIKMGYGILWIVLAFPVVHRAGHGWDGQANMSNVTNRPKYLKMKKPLKSISNQNLWMMCQGQMD